MISKAEILKGKPCPPELEANLRDLVNKLNVLRALYGKPMVVTSGYRTPEDNARVGGAKNSAHLHCQAADFRDYSRDLSNWCLKNIDKLEELDLWIESPSHTPTWLHIQTRPAKNRIFNP